jgi:hypothetical protein
MNRRGFFGMMGKLLAVGTAIGVSPKLLAPMEEKLEEWTSRFIQVGGPPIGEMANHPEGTCYAFQLEFNPNNPETRELEDVINLFAKTHIEFKKEHADFRLGS